MRAVLHAPKIGRSQHRDEVAPSAGDQSRDDLLPFVVVQARRRGFECLDEAAQQVHREPTKVRSVSRDRSRSGVVTRRPVDRRHIVHFTHILCSFHVVFTFRLPLADAPGCHRVGVPEHSRPLDRLIEMVRIVDEHGTLVRPPHGSNPWCQQLIWC